MKWFTIVLCCMAGFLVSSATFAPTCAVISNPFRTTDFDNVKIIVAPSAMSLLSGIQSGMDQWNDSACVSPRNPIPYPFFTTWITSPNAPTITLEKANGFEVLVGASACGRFTGPANGQSATITLYTMGRTPDGFNHSCGLNNENRVSNIVAHELGHYLNLDDTPGCAGGIMGKAFVNPDGTVDDDRSVLASECSLADSESTTPTESSGSGGGDAPPPPPPPLSSPILIDLNRNAFHLAQDPVFFDIDADGELELVSWTLPDQEDGFLCLDRNGNGQIDDGSELFGNATRMEAGHRAAHGYIALAEFDEGLGGNFDRKITVADALFGDLCLWFDRNHNGVSEPDELLSLAAAGVVEISLDVRFSERHDSIGNEFVYLSRAKIMKHGQLKPTWTTDVFFVLYD